MSLFNETLSNQYSTKKLHVYFDLLPHIRYSFSSKLHLGKSTSNLILFIFIVFSLTCIITYNPPTKSFKLFRRPWSLSHYIYVHGSNVTKEKKKKRRRTSTIPEKKERKNTVNKYVTTILFKQFILRSYNNVLCVCLFFLSFSK